MVALFGVASFLGAALLFLVEPMLAKLVLPSYGGSPMVWNTCMLFFQAVLLASYLYVHVSTRRLGRRRQPWTHLGLLALPLLALPIGLPGDAEPPDGADPTLWLLRVLVVAVGLPFALLATTGPLLQRWFSWTGHRRAGDPYFLYAASNAGSVVGLLGYPFVVEPAVGLATQTRWWSAAYVGFALLIAVCGIVAVRAPGQTGEVAAPPSPSDEVGRVSVRQRAGWVALAFLPSSLMLGVTTHASTDIAAVPLFWTVPLAVYLGTFVVAFSRSSREPPRTTTLVAAALAMVALLEAATPWAPPVWFSLGLLLATLGAVGLAAHGRLAASRPDPSLLTGFYLWVALGGALGGLLNGLLAPAVLDRPLEYPLLLCSVPLLLVGLVERPRPRPLLLRPAVWVSGLLVVGLMAPTLLQRGVLLRDRTFYGSYRVRGTEEIHLLGHGTTLHGWQLFGAGRESLPTSYYSRTGPIGDVMAAYDGPQLDRVAVVGMGAGTLAAYGRPGQQMDFYEIDPAVVRIAEDSGLFTFVGDSQAEIEVVLGDARLSLREAPEAAYGVVVLDAFSSDAIPAHLLSVEALADYRRTLAQGGLLAFHVTNRHVDLVPVLAAVAARLGMSGVVRTDPDSSRVKSTSEWVVLAEDETDLAPLLRRPGWESLPPPSVRVWTDDYTSLFQVLDLG